MKSQRLSRIEEMIHQLLGEMIRGQLTDPRIGFTTVTRVEVTRNLASCKVYVSTMGEENAQQESLAGLNHAAGFLRKQLSSELTLRRVPELRFYEDKALHEADHVFEILEKLKREEKNR